MENRVFAREERSQNSGVLPAENCCDGHYFMGCCDDPPYSVCCVNCPINGPGLRAWIEEGRR